MARTLGDEQRSQFFLAGKHRDKPKPVFGQERERRASHISKGTGAANVSGRYQRAYDPHVQRGEKEGREDCYACRNDILGLRPIAVTQPTQFCYALTGRKLKRRRDGFARFASCHSTINPAIKTSHGRRDHGVQILLSALVEMP